MENEKAEKAEKAEKELSPSQRDALLGVLKARFETHSRRHPALAWAAVQARLEAQPQKLWSLQEMERTGGEPDVVAHAGPSGTIVFCDCSAESPSGRRSLCYDRAALDARRAAKPEGSAVEMAAGMGIELLGEEEYRALQRWGAFDTKTSSWLKTPADIRAQGGAIFADYRYGHVFVYHNGAQSYYAARGFRGALRV